MNLPTPNTVTEGDGFYISYNYRDRDFYGDDTTALVWGQMQKFYILVGDHRAAYAPLVAQGWEACFAYYKANIALSHKHSDKLPD